VTVYPFTLKKQCSSNEEQILFDHVHIFVLPRVARVHGDLIANSLLGDAVV
jgi:hypothetical protein